MNDEHRHQPPSGGLEKVDNDSGKQTSVRRAGTKMAKPSSLPNFMPVDKAAFLRAIAAHDAVMDKDCPRPDAAGDVATAYRLRAGAELGRVIDSPRRPLTRPARYFLTRTYAVDAQESA